MEVPGRAKNGAGWRQLAYRETVPIFISFKRGGAASPTIIKIEGKLPRLVFTLPFRNCERDKNRLKKRREREGVDHGRRSGKPFSPLSSLCLAEAFSASSNAAAFGKERGSEEKRKIIPEVLNLEVETIETATALTADCCEKKEANFLL